MKVFDGHGDLFSHFTDLCLAGETNLFEKYHIDNFKKGEVAFGVFNIWLDRQDMLPKKRVEQILTCGAKEFLTSKHLKLVTRYEDFDFNDERVQFIIGLEGIDYLDSANELYAMYSYGARLVSLTWNNSNKFATSITSDKDYGLTKEGQKAIAIMDQLGMIIDISHLSDKSAHEILDIAKNPVVASHSNVRNLASHKRNLSDELILRVAKSNGVIGMNSCALFVSDDDSKKNLDGLIAHIDYLNDLVGIEHIALGFDFMDYLNSESITSFIGDGFLMSDFHGHRDVQKLIDKLQLKGYSNEDIEKIAYKNFMRVIKEVI